MRNLIVLSFILFSFVGFSQPGKIDSTFNVIAGFNAQVNVTATQQDGKIIVAGAFTKFKFHQTNRIARLNSDGSFDYLFNTGSGFNDPILTVKIQDDGKLIIGGAFTNYNGQMAYALARLNIDGSLDKNFNTPIIALASISTVAIQPDGKIIAGGSFNLSNQTSFKSIIRFNSDGSIDNTFNNTNSMVGVTSIKLCTDGKIIVCGGSFSSGFIYRLNSDGSTDTSFKTGTGPNNTITDIAIQSDSKIVAVGSFTTFNSLTANRIVRLNLDGSNDNSFCNAGKGGDDQINSVDINNNDKIAIGGRFQNYYGIPLKEIALLNPDGSPDSNFKIGNGFDWSVLFVSFQPNDQIMVAGGYGSFNNMANSRLARLYIDGSKDNLFLPSKGAGDEIKELAIQADGKIIIGGYFKTYNGIETNYIARLNSDGSLDSSFNIGSGPNNGVEAIRVLKNGRILIAGNFTTFNNIPANYLACINPDGSLNKSLNFGTGTDDVIYSICIQQDEKIILGGNFKNYDGHSVNNIVRLNSDCSYDASFISGAGINGAVLSIKVRPDGKILVAGSFTVYNNIVHGRIDLINSDGSEGNWWSGGVNGTIEDMYVQADGNIIIGGSFTSSYSTGGTYIGIARLTPPGYFDNTFKSGNGVDLYVNSVIGQSDGKVLIAGNFRKYNGVPRNSIARILPDGSLDATFDPEYFTAQGSSRYTVNCLGLQNDGKILAGGLFSDFCSISVNNICRINSDPVNYNIIRGNIFFDVNKNCSRDNLEQGIENIIVKAEPGPWFGSTDNNGNYEIKVDTNKMNYTISQINNYLADNYQALFCPSGSYSVNLDGKSLDTCCFNFADTTNKNCSLLKIDISSSHRRRCFRNSTYIKYSNLAEGWTSNVELKVNYAHYVVPLQSTPNWSLNQGDTLLVFNIDTLGPRESRVIEIIDSTKCISGITGLTQCTKATISPRGNCKPIIGGDNSNLEVIGICNNGVSFFDIENIGTGDMKDSTSCRVYENDTLIYIKKIKLNESQKFSLNLPAYGNTIRVEVDQTNPFLYSHPKAIIEACGTNLGSVKKGYVTTTPQDDEDDAVSYSCLPIIDSFDPNEKEANPTGITKMNYIKNKDKINYTIRFQNTGTDTAYNITIIDTLSSNLDIQSFLPGVSSHLYSYKITGQSIPVITFYFNGIKLPDSSKSYEKSIGLIKYSIYPKSDLLDDQIIENQASIYFDFNDPIKTNTTHQVIFQNDPLNLSKSYYVNVSSVSNSVINKNQNNFKIFPNPFSDAVNIQLYTVGTKSTFNLYSMYGNLVLEENINSNSQIFQTKNIPKGMYYYEITSEGDGIINSGKLIKQ